MIATALALLVTVHPAAAETGGEVFDLACVIAEQELQHAGEQLARAEYMAEQMAAFSGERDQLYADAAEHRAAAEELIRRAERLSDAMATEPIEDPGVEKRIEQILENAEREHRFGTDARDLARTYERAQRDAERELQHAVDAVEKAEHDLAACED